MKRTYKSGERVTDDERAFIRRNALCPDCGVGNFLEGPTGGLSINVMCDRCSSKFNFHGCMAMYGADRISDSYRDKESDEYGQAKLAKAQVVSEGLPSGFLTTTLLIIAVVLAASLVALTSGCSGYDRAAEEAKEVFGDAPIQCENIDDGYACQNLCTKKVLFCPHDGDGCRNRKGCYFVENIKLNTPAVSCPKAERRIQ
jgi:hypothetical protein